MWCSTQSGRLTNHATCNNRYRPSISVGCLLFAGNMLGQRRVTIFHFHAYTHWCGRDKLIHPNSSGNQNHTNKHWANHLRQLSSPYISTSKNTQLGRIVGGMPRNFPTTARSIGVWWRTYYEIKYSWLRLLCVYLVCSWAIIKCLAGGVIRVQAWCEYVIHNLAGEFLPHQYNVYTIWGDCILEQRAWFYSTRAAIWMRRR